MQLEARWHGGLPVVGKRFNSILVQLEAVRRVMGAGLLEFQFHIGAIRSTIPRNFTIFHSRFQFHIGAIRRNTQCIRKLPHIISFQFHIGAIRSNRDFSQGAVDRKSFNSILVQLEAPSKQPQPVTIYLVSIPYWCN